MPEAATNKPATECDGHSVAVIVGWCEFVLIGNTPLSHGSGGASSVGGHVYDEFTTPEEAAAGEVLQEVGLTVTSLKRESDWRWRPNACRRGDGPHGRGHFWRLYSATVEGDLKVDENSLRDVRWVPQGELQELAVRTLAYVRCEVTEDDWRRTPGIALTWVLWLRAAGLVRMSDSHLEEIERFIARGTGRR